MLDKVRALSGFHDEADGRLGKVHVQAKNFVGPGVSDVKKGSSFEEVTTKKYGDHFHIDDYDANLKRAKELLAEAGYPEPSTVQRKRSLIDVLSKSLISLKNTIQSS